MGIIFTVRNPRKGNNTNCRHMPVTIAFVFRICVRRESTSTVADIPKTRKNRRILPTTDSQSTLMNVGFG
jgi:hypothetical protein